MKLSDVMETADIDTVIADAREYVRKNTESWYTNKRKGIPDAQNMSIAIMKVCASKGDFITEEKLKEILKRMGYK